MWQYTVRTVEIKEASSVSVEVLSKGKDAKYSTIIDATPVAIESGWTSRPGVVLCVVVVHGRREWDIEKIVENEILRKWRRMRYWGNWRDWYVEEVTEDEVLGKIEDNEVSAPYAHYVHITTREHILIHMTIMWTTS